MFPGSSARTGNIGLWGALLAALLLAAPGVLAPAHAAAAPRAVSEAPGCVEAERPKEESPRHRVTERARSRRRPPRGRAPAGPRALPTRTPVRPRSRPAGALPSRAGARIAYLQVFRC
ncbi:hypothetical protein ABT354_17795 [Streptomyces sp. NPDC000594]|uniref:hypothetical protein n=1 Tax=Streptomyces sp. NPDC000594 TaxID=3154261 RepID=UPI00331CA337